MINLSDIYHTRIYNQYRDKLKARQWYDIVPSLGQQLADVYDDIRTTYDIDTAAGDQLDVIGRLVGASRNLIGTVALDTYECDEQKATCGNSFAQPSVEYVNDKTALSDEYYRTLIKAKIAKNTSNATIDSIINAVKLIIQDNDDVKLIDHFDMSFSIELSGTLTAVERELLKRDILPRPQGVRIAGIIYFENVVEFGDDSLQFGDLDAECVGYI